MRAEEQLKLAYMTIVELKDQNAKLVDAVAALERRLAESDGLTLTMIHPTRSCHARGLRPVV